MLTSFAGSALAIKTADSVDASGSVEASGIGAIVDVDRTIGSGPTVDADARISADRIGTGGSVITDGRS